MNMPAYDAQTARPRITPRNLPLLLLKAREAVLAGFRPILNHFGLTEQQWRVIRTLSEQGEMEPRQICEAAQILSPSLTGVLSRMEELGLVERHRMAEDQRRVQVRLTARSEDIVTRMIPLIEAQYARVEEQLGPQLIARLYELLDQVLAQDVAGIPTVELPPSGSSERTLDVQRPAQGVADRSTRRNR